MGRQIKIRARLLLVDDDQEFLDDTTAILSRDFDCVAVSDPSGVLEKCDAEDPDAVLLDLDFHGQPLGFDILTDILERYRFLPVIMWTEADTIESALEAQERGAFHYVVKTAKPADIMPVIDAALRRRRVLIANSALRKEVENSWGDFVYASDAIGRLLGNLGKIALSDHAVLLTGETGVGKGLIAREIHRRSKRANGPFVVVECAALPETIIENELFGHEKGAYTGAGSRQIGSSETADGGTLFLDEVGDMPLNSQAKILRLADEGRFKRLGGARERSVDVRIIAATNRDLEVAVKQERFRKDLFYRLNTFRLHIPPLRERREDIGPLARHFLSACGGVEGKEVSIPQRVLLFLQSQEWPGNVRELKHAIERACAVAAGPALALGDFGSHRVDQLHPMDYAAAKEKVLRDFRRGFLLEALQRNNGNIKKAAEQCGLSRQSFYRFMAEAGVRLENE